jgi:hypothetical protein
MVREYLLALGALPLCACSLALDFSDKAVPKDAAIDAPYTADECAYKEPNDTPDTAAVVVPDQDSGPAAICSTTPGVDDADWYRFTVPAATASVTVSISFVDRPTGDLDLRVFDKTGATKLGESVGFGDGESVTCPGTSPRCDALAPDDYLFEVYPALGGAVNNYTFALTITPM